MGIARLAKSGPNGSQAIYHAPVRAAIAHSFFMGGMTAKKYCSINNVSKATATRDLIEMVELKVIIPFGSGRSVHYDLYTDQVEFFGVSK